MGGERLWWTWGMAGPTVPNTSLLLYSSGSGDPWNGTEQDAFNETGGNSSGNGNGSLWPAEGSPLGAERLIQSIAIAIVLTLIILFTVVGESRILRYCTNNVNR